MPGVRSRPAHRNLRGAHQGVQCRALVDYAVRALATRAHGMFRRVRQALIHANPGDVGPGRKAVASLATVAGGAAIESAVKYEGRVDKCKVGERLREVSEHVARRPRFFCEQSKRTGVAEHSLEKEPG